MIKKYRKPFLAIIDGIIIYLSYFLAIQLRFAGTYGGKDQSKFLNNLESVIWFYVLIGIVILFAVGFYRKLTTQASMVELVSIVIAVTISSALHYVLPYLFIKFSGNFLPRSVLLIAFFMQIVLISGVRLIWRIASDKELKALVVSDITKNILFSPPDISNIEIEEVVNAMRSGWITTGPRTKEFERRIAEYIGVKRAVCLNSATASMELTLRILGVGPGDEIITSPYTYTASASVIYHVGAKIVLVDTAPDSFEMDYSKLADAITERTKVIIPVDIAGKMCDYDAIYNAVESRKDLFKANNEIQELFNRCIVLSDAAHAFGAKRKGKNCGQVADFTCFSFHAVKNLTTAEGGAVVWRNDNGLDNDWLYNQYMLYSLHGQSKDAFTKSQKGSWEYDVIYPAYKCNMTDILAGFGLMQLGRYDSLLQRRREIIEHYDRELIPLGIERLEHFGDDFTSTGHLYLARVPGIDEVKRNEIIIKMAKAGISTNVHYKPLPMLTAYKNLGLDIDDYPNAFAMYRNEITLPLHTLLSDEDVDYICKNFKKAISKVIDETAKSLEMEKSNETTDEKSKEDELGKKNV
jgi:dTDP-4-amino-4,6-dideoxygalactose transaminase